MKQDIKQFRAVAQNLPPKDRWRFSRYVHILKRQSHRGSGRGGDFTFQEIQTLLEEFLAK